MARLKLGPLADEKPVKLTVELPAAVHRDLLAYAEALGQESATGAVIEPGRLIAPMLARFMATDRGFAKLRRPTVEAAAPAAATATARADAPG